MKNATGAQVVAIGGDAAALTPVRTTRLSSTYRADRKRWIVRCCGPGRLRTARDKSAATGLFLKLDRGRPISPYEPYGHSSCAAHR